MTLPNFLIIGAPKAGTTSIYFYLKQHPQVYMSPIKDPRFFALGGQGPEEETQNQGPQTGVVKDFETYQNLFAAVTKEIAIGEASPGYLHSTRAPERIKHYIPEAKLIVILRNPVERTYSEYLMHIRQEREDLRDFGAALDIALQEAQEGSDISWWHERPYVRRSFYYPYLQRYFELFGEEQIQVYLYDDLVMNPYTLHQKIFDFLGVDPDFLPDMSCRYNTSDIPRSRRLHTLVNEENRYRRTLRKHLPEAVWYGLAQAINRWNVIKPPPLKSETCRRLLKIYEDDILKTQELLGLDLTTWLVEVSEDEPC